MAWDLEQFQRMEAAFILTVLKYYLQIPYKSIYFDAQGLSLPDRVNGIEFRLHARTLGATEGCLREVSC